MKSIKFLVSCFAFTLICSSIYAQNNYKLALLSDYVGTEPKGALTVDGYKVSKTIDLNDKQSKDLIKQLKKKKNIEKAVKRCKSQPQYALILNGAPYATIDLTTCPKVTYFKANNDVEFVDLKVDNSVIEYISTLVK